MHAISLFSKGKVGQRGREGVLHVPTFVATPPCDSAFAAHCRIRAEAALRSWPRLACAVLDSSPIMVAWKKQRARSVVLIRS